MDDPLAGLDDIPWDRLRHACGPPVDTPRRLRQIARGEADDETWHELYASITNQDLVDEASAAAAPFLINLTRVTSGKDLVYVLGLLDAIASGVTLEPEVRERCVRAAELGLPRYVELLSSTDPEVRVLASGLVATFQKSARAARPGFEAALDARQNPRARAGMLANYARLVGHESKGLRSRLRALVGGTDLLAAARAAFGLLKSVKNPPDPSWVDAVVRRLVTPRTLSGDVGADDLYVGEVVHETPATWWPMLLDALLRAFPDVRDRAKAFDLGGALLFLAFHRRLGGPARPPRPFVIVESLRFPMPVHQGGMWIEAEVGLPSAERSADVEFVCEPFMNTWDHLAPDGEDEDSAPTVNVAKPVTAESLTPDERRVVEALARSDAYWRTDSDLLSVYGLPARRRELAAHVGG